MSFGLLLIFEEFLSYESTAWILGKYFPKKELNNDLSIDSEKREKKDEIKGGKNENDENAEVVLDMI